MSMMDLDFDFEDDKIKAFLLGKLEEIKANNDKLQHTIHERRQFLNGVLESSNAKVDENVKITSEVWKKIFNRKYALGFAVENDDCRCLHKINVLLKWSSPYPLQYEVFIYEQSDDPHKVDNPAAFFCNEESCSGLTNSLRRSNKIEKLAYVVVVLECPKFTDKLSYTITGNVIFQQDESQIVLMFPPVEISPEDATNNHLNDSLLPRGEITDILTLISCTERTDLLMKFPNGWRHSVDSTFEILCTLKKVDLSSNCRKFFISTRLSPTIDGSLLEFHASNEANKNVHYITVYARNEDCLLSLLHHLHQNIAGVVIIPKIFDTNYMLRNVDNVPDVEENLEKFKDCVNREIHFVDNFLQEIQSIKEVGDDDVIKFRADLADLEKRTDLLYIRICQLNDQS